MAVTGQRFEVQRIYRCAQQWYLEGGNPLPPGNGAKGFAPSNNRNAMFVNQREA
jgi:hypothetical protein